MHTVSVPAAIQVNMSIDLMQFVPMQQRTYESVTVLKTDWIVFIFPDMLALLVEIKHQIIIH